ncbi:MAG: GatB/YqeY domain-containing protein, partial [bacterium]
RRKESIEAFKEGGREDLVLKEGKELVILEEYLPSQLSPEELKSLIQEAIESTGASTPGDMGKVMKEIMPKVQGKADGKTVNQKVKELLSS